MLGRDNFQTLPVFWLVLLLLLLLLLLVTTVDIIIFILSILSSLLNIHILTWSCQWYTDRRSIFTDRHQTLGKIEFDDQPIPFEDPNIRNLMAECSITVSSHLIIGLQAVDSALGLRPEVPHYVWLPLYFLLGEKQWLSGRRLRPWTRWPRFDPMFLCRFGLSPSLDLGRIAK